MTTAQVVDTSVTVNNNSPIQEYVHLDDQTQPTFEMTPGFKPFTIFTMVYKRVRGWTSGRTELPHIKLLSTPPPPPLRGSVVERANCVVS